MTRYIVDGREFDQFDYPDANDAADGQFPPFRVFDIDRQLHTPTVYGSREEAQRVADKMNAGAEALADKIEANA